MVKTPEQTTSRLERLEEILLREVKEEYLTSDFKYNPEQHFSETDLFDVKTSIRMTRPNLNQIEETDLKFDLKDTYFLMQIYSALSHDFEQKYRNIFCEKILEASNQYTVYLILEMEEGNRKIN